MSDPATIAIAAAVATSAAQKISESATEGTIAAFKALCKKVFVRFRSIPEAQDALDAARIDEDDTAALRTVATALDKAAQDDPEIGRLMEELRRAASEDHDGAVHNTTGKLGDNAKVLQSRDIIHGNIRM